MADTNKPHDNLDLDRFWTKAKKTFEICKSETEKFIKLGKSKWDVTALANERSHLLKKLGTQTLRMVELGEIANEELKEISKKIRSLESRIDAQEKHMRDITQAAMAADAAADETTPAPASQKVEDNVGPAESISTAPSPTHAVEKKTEPLDAGSKSVKKKETKPKTKKNS